MRFLILLILFSLWHGPLFGAEWSKGEKVAMLNGSGAALITAWGVLYWDYFKTSPRQRDEGWFAASTKEGGADKFGHAYTSYLGSHLIAYYYKNIGYDAPSAAALGALSSWMLMGFMELGDSFSYYGFAYEDMVMNTAGCLWGYLSFRYPAIGRKLDYRLEYWPMFKKVDVFTDYEHIKYLLALKFSGFSSFSDSLARFFELHVGYFARGFPSHPDKSRNIFVGAGVNLTAIFDYKLFRYMKMPFTSVRHSDRIHY